jgi:hypothetical protein
MNGRRDKYPKVACVRPNINNFYCYRIAKERLRNKFRFSNRKLRRGRDAAVEGPQQCPVHVHNMAYNEHSAGENGICFADVSLEAKHHYQEDLTSS